MKWTIRTWNRSPLLSKGVSSFVSLIGSLQASVRRGIVRRLLGPSWSGTAVDAACYHLLRVSSELHDPYVSLFPPLARNVETFAPSTNCAVPYDAQCSFHGNDRVPKGNSHHVEYRALL
jgi:hypothetical protein